MKSGGDPMPPGRRLEAAVVAAAAAAAVVIYAIRGGSYDLIAWSQSGVVVWWALALGTGLGVLPRARLPRQAALVVAAFALLAGWTLLALMWTESAERTTAEFTRVLHHLGLVLLAACVLTPRTWMWAVWGVFAGAAVVAALAVASRLDPGSFPADTVQASFGGNRLNYPLNYWNAVAAWSTVTAGMALALSSHAANFALRALALAAVPVIVLSGYLTYSRQAAGGMAVAIVLVWAVSRHRATVILHALAAGGGAWIAIRAVRDRPEIVEATGATGAGSVIAALVMGSALAAAVALATGWLRLDRRLRMPRRAGITVAVIAALAVAGAAVAVLPPVASEAWSEFRNEATASEDIDQTDPASRIRNLQGNRYNLWVAAHDAFQAQPTTGIGPGAYQFWWSREGVNAERVRDAHSLFAESLAEMGWPGFVLVLALLAGLLAAAGSARTRAQTQSEVGAATAAVTALIVWIAHAGLDWMWESTANTAVVMLLVGATLTCGSNMRRFNWRPWHVPLALLAAGAALAFLPGMAALSKVRESQRAVNVERLEEALAAAQEAVQAQPWGASPYLQRALVLETRGDLSGARSDVLRAAEREPTNWRHFATLARVEAQAGRPERALDAWRRSRELLEHSFFSP